MFYFSIALFLFIIENENCKKLFFAFYLFFFFVNNFILYSSLTRALSNSHKCKEAINLVNSHTHTHIQQNKPFDSIYL